MSNERNDEALRKRFMARVITPKGKDNKIEETYEAKHGIEKLKHNKTYNSDYFSNYQSNTLENTDNT